MTHTRNFFVALALAFAALVPGAAQTSAADGGTGTHGAQVIAHRGAWNGSDAPQNSRASLCHALTMDIYGSETDVWLTTDGELFVNHDPTREGLRLEDSSSRQVKALRLANGESLPRLADFLSILKASSSPVRLVLEVKPHSTPQRNAAAARAAVKAVGEAGLQAKVEYISFSLDACKAICEADPEALVAYLNGDMAPADLKPLGIRAIDYNQGVLRKHPEWVKEAHDLGMTVNVWTVDKVSAMAEMTELGTDFITTNKPAVAARLREVYGQ